MNNKFKVVRIDREGAADDPMIEERKELSKIDAGLIGVDCTSEEDIINSCKDADAITTVRLPISRNVIESLPKCRVIVRYGVGFDNIDVDAATDNGIVVVNLPHYCIEEVSNQALAFLLCFSRKMLFLDASMKRGQWLKSKQGRWVRGALGPMGSIYGQTLGLIGCGNIGRMTARKAQCFRLRLLGVDPYVERSLAEESGVSLVTLSELLKESDFISLHVPLNEETRHLFGEDEFKQMKPTAYLINTSRGPVVNERALIKALNEKWIAGAGLDVFEKEPIEADNPLLSMDNVILTPHSANYSDNSVYRQEKSVGQEVARVLSGRLPKNVVNHSVRPRFTLTI